MSIIINTFLDKDNTIHSTGKSQPEVINVLPTTDTYFGAYNLEINSVNFELIMNSLAEQQTVETLSVNNLITTDLFNTNGYYGYIAYPNIFGVLTSLKQNGGEEQLSAWVNCGVFNYNGNNFIVYRTYIPKAYQPNQTLNFTR